MTHLRDRIAQIIFDMGDGGASINCNKTADAILAHIKLSRARERVAELEAEKIDTAQRFREAFAANIEEDYDHD
jgi:hypothetical protein